jgi:hypothetical protein
MPSKTFLSKSFIFLLFTIISLYSCNQKPATTNKINSILEETNGPISVKMELNKNQKIAAKEGRLTLLNPATKKIIPVQLEQAGIEANADVITLLPNEKIDLSKIKLIENKYSLGKVMKTALDANTGQIIIKEEDKKILQYNYQTVYEKDVIRPGSQKDEELSFSNMSGVYYEEYLKAHPELKKNDTTKSSIYSVPRSDYIHPLYGLEGEMLTSDWPDGGHPHHRGIFWAWPEVEYKTQRADIYALQRVFARPTGNIKYTSGSVYAEIDAENLWMWEDNEAIVNEHAIIRVYRSTADTRIIDLTIKLLALKDSVTIATRFTNSYGGLNLRMQTPEDQEISFFTDKANAEPLRAWSDFNGIFEGNKSTSGLMVLQHQENPEYPGEWREYPDLAWVQPTFPTPETRYTISKEEPLVLRYRLIIHAGGKPGETISKKNWDAYHSSRSPR